MAKPDKAACLAFRTAIAHKLWGAEDESFHKEIEWERDQEHENDLRAYHAQQDIQIKGGDEKSQARWDRCTVSVNLKLTPLKAARRTSPPWLSLCSNFSTATQASTSCSSRACLSKKDPQSTNIQMYAYRLLTLFLSDSCMCQGSRLVAP